MPAHVLDNCVWHALHGAHAGLRDPSTHGRAVRYDPEISPFGAVDELDEGGWEALNDCLGEQGFVALFRDAVPSVGKGWVETLRLPGVQMVADALVPESALDAPRPELVVLGADDVPEMLGLTALTEPGPFLQRTIELGRYYGLRERGRLVAMAGQRMRPPGWIEISAVCTHPDAQRRGLAAHLTLRLAEEIRAGGDEAFLHAVTTNERAIRLYEKLGFRIRRPVECVIATPEPRDG